MVLNSYLFDVIARKLLSADECPETKSPFHRDENLSLLNKIIYGHNFWSFDFESGLFRMNILRTSRQLQNLRTYQSVAGKSLGEFKLWFWICEISLSLVISRKFYVYNLFNTIASQLNRKMRFMGSQYHIFDRKQM